MRQTSPGATPADLDKDMWWLKVCVVAPPGGKTHRRALNKIKLMSVAGWGKAAEGGSGGKEAFSGQPSWGRPCVVGGSAANPTWDGQTVGCP